MEQIGIIGAGTMGSGLAQLALVHEHPVHLIDLRPAQLDAARSSIATRLAALVDKGKLGARDRDAALARLQTRTTIDALQDCALVIEAVVEQLPVKHEVFAALEKAAPDAVLASNTSSLAIADIARAVARPGRVIGMHFFNPAPVLPLVEVIAGLHSDPHSVDRAVTLALRWGKTPVRAKDTPGFIVNRVARGFYLEALRLLDEGVADLARIDQLLREQAGFKTGPFELMDRVGIDVNLEVSRSVWLQFDRAARFAPHPLQAERVRAGQLGHKSGVGFYDHGQQPPRPAVLRPGQPVALGPQAAAIAALGVALGAPADDPVAQLVLARVVGAIFNEAGRAAEAEVASAEDIDRAMQLGTAYPQGPLTWAAAIGHAVVRAGLEALEGCYGDGRYDPGTRFRD